MKLLQASHEEINEILDEMRKEREIILNNIVEICFFMRGSISWNDAWDLSFNSMKAIKRRIEQNIEITKNSGIAVI